MQSKDSQVIVNACVLKISTGGGKWAKVVVPQMTFLVSGLCPVLLGS